MEKLHEERNMLLDTIEDLKQTVTGPELDTRVSLTNKCCVCAQDGDSGGQGQTS